jgi:methionyl-tRNA formyltransferase
MRLFFLTVEEPFYLPDFFAMVLNEVNAETVGAAIVKHLYKKESNLSVLRKIISSFGVNNAIKLSYKFYILKIIDKIYNFTKVKKYHTVKRTFESYFIPYFETEDINDSEIIQNIKRLAPDLIIAISLPQVIRKELLDIPTLGVINLHMSLLPEYRGIMSIFWMLLNGDKVGGVTCHFVNEKIDAGEIIAQQEYNFGESDSLDALIRKSKKIGAEVILEVIEKFRMGTIETQINDPNKGEYYGFPTKEDVKIFLEKGRKLR